VYRIYALIKPLPLAPIEFSLSRIRKLILACPHFYGKKWQSCQSTAPPGLGAGKAGAVRGHPIRDTESARTNETI
jgi:hypothetical protein